MQYFTKHILFIIFLSTFLYICTMQFFQPIFQTSSIIIPYALHPFDICKKAPDIWYFLKIFYIIFSYISYLIIFNSIFTKLFHRKKTIANKTDELFLDNKKLNLYVGTDSISNKKVFIPENGLFQNVLVTGTIGSGKTSSFMYPTTKQLIEFECNNSDKKLGLLILDVKGNYYTQVKQYAKNCNRENDLVIIELRRKYKI